MTSRPTIQADRTLGEIINNGDWNSQAIQRALYTQEVIQGQNADKIPLAAISGVNGNWENILDNGGMEIWQRGNGPYTANGICADRWGIALTGSSTITASRTLSTDPTFGSLLMIGGNYTHVGGGSCQFYQNIENWREYRGKALYLFARGLSPGGTGMFASMNDGVNAAFSNRTVTNTWTTMTCTFTPSVSSATHLQVIVTIDSQTNNSYGIDNVMLVLSNTAPAAYAQRPYPEELRRCRRYYQVVHASQRFRSQGTTAEVHGEPVLFPVRMGGTPTATISAGTRGNVTSVLAQDIDDQGLRLELTATAANTDSFSVDDTLTLEVNP